MLRLAGIVDAVGRAMAPDLPVTQRQAPAWRPQPHGDRWCAARTVFNAVLNQHVQEVNLSPAGHVRTWPTESIAANVCRLLNNPEFA